ncbi:hypothetical protein [Oryzomonas rubra]|uniref:Uncharacterized protein n=1 Tax=Oryzomonas rubra TaxID=2509454 RepID=A0A5A9X8J3_9BACT|nr:hypothetical protein [Oryzomonas rubra]KAA0888715.1 hypothetical protein ET418_15150 [Oryzomonas rubra]
MEACSNPECPHHEIPLGKDGCFEVRTIKGIFPNQTIENRLFKSHLYRDDHGRDLYFCDICHSAIWMVQNGGHR